MAQLKITQIKSTVGAKPAIRDSVRSLGLKRVGDVVVKEDSPVVRGMVRTAAHLLTMEEVD